MDRSINVESSHKKNPNYTRMEGFTGKAVATAAGILAIAGCTPSEPGAAPESNTPVAVETSVEAPSTTPSSQPEVTGETTPEPAESLTSLEFSSSAEDLVNNFINTGLEWRYTSGSEADIADTREAFSSYTGADPYSFADELAEQNADAFVDILFPEDWESNADIVEYRSDMVERNANIILTNLKNYVNETPYLSETAIITGVQEFTSSIDYNTAYGADPLYQSLGKLVDSGEARVIVYDYEAVWENNTGGASSDHNLEMNVFGNENGKAKLIYATTIK